MTLLILYDTVHIVAGHTSPIVFLINVELVAVVSVQAIAGGRPDESVVVKINLISEIT
jgi:hypothetical protein